MALSPFDIEDAIQDLLIKIDESKDGATDLEVWKFLNEWGNDIDLAESWREFVVGEADGTLK